MVGVDALIASWCKIFKPESHLVASSLESAGGAGTREQKYRVTLWEDLCLDTPAPASPTPYTVENGKSLCQFVALQEGIRKASPLHGQECKTCFLSETRPYTHDEPSPAGVTSRQFLKSFSFQPYANEYDSGITE